MDAIARNLLDARTLFESLESTLLAQHRYLLERNMVEVENSANQLRVYVDRIRLNAHRRNQQLVSAGLSADDAGMRQHIQSLPEVQKITTEQLWQDLEARVGRCRELNIVNGRLQGRLRVVTSKLLELLWGQLPGRSYNRSGQLNQLAVPKGISDA
ncbi:flagellar protein FlgN [Sansalvadorimonas verongulae]|uniref:flagellar protein FlgN n=1 Tax=Sansalvadorimonas verongulae TaxID=2172824 RepID=UPI0012BC50C8|nr:flagellar protein FlgN [Sansalvadorimonas verongulae]MTI13475.1 flagellar protein FlgN [Sansalvadorimonas verongulae]